MTKQSKNTDEPQVMASDIPAPLRRDSTPTLFADGLLGGSIESGVVRLELLARQFDAESKSLSSVIVGRLVMPTERALLVSRIWRMAVGRSMAEW